jgi:DNA-binding transcriptional LysR family regulator
MALSSSVLLNRLLARGKLRHVQVLLQLAELGSVQRTADAIGMTQSSVTQSLAYIERLLEMPLFHRHPRGVRPTPACLDLLPVAHQIMSGLATGAEAMAARHNAGQGMVRLYASGAAIHGLLIPALDDFNGQYPGIVVQLQEAEREDLLMAATSALADIVVCRRPAVVPAGWRYEALVEDHLVVVCAPRHPMARRRRLRWTDLAGATWLLPPAGAVAREHFEALAQEFPAPAHTHPLVTRSMSTIFWLLRNKALLSLLPFRSVRHLVEEGVLVALSLQIGRAMEPIGMLLPEADAREAPTRLAAHLHRLQSMA